MIPARWTTRLRVHHVFLMAGSVLLSLAALAGTAENLPSSLSSASVNAARPASSAATEATNEEPPAVSLGDFFRQTETFLRPLATNELLGLATELNARGYAAAAQKLQRSLATSDADRERLATRLIQYGQFSAAQDLLTNWHKQQPETMLPHWLAAVAHVGAGESELAQRELEAVGEPPPPLKAPARLLRLLVGMQRQGRVAGVEDNPWNIDFGNARGEIQPGQIEPAQQALLPPDATAALRALLDLLPTQGNWWALLGDLFNAQGDTAAALRCYQRAEILLYTPRPLLVRQRALALYERQRVQQAEQSLQASTTSASSTVSASPSNNPLTNNGLPPNEPRAVMSAGVGAILGGGAVLLVLLGWLQVREWTRGRRRSR